MISFFYKKINCRSINHLCVMNIKYKYTFNNHYLNIIKCNNILKDVLFSLNINNNCSYNVNYVIEDMLHANKSLVIMFYIHSIIDVFTTISNQDANKSLYYCVIPLISLLAACKLLKVEFFPHLRYQVVSTLFLIISMFLVIKR